MGRRASRKRELEEHGVARAMAEVVDRPAAGADCPAGRTVRRPHPLRPKNDAQRELISSIEVATVVFAIGAAGTGKTYVAISKAIEFLASGRVDRLILARPAVEAGAERIGFLPGDLRAKMDPYMRPLYDVLFERIGWSAVNAMLRNGKIEIAPLAFMRGRTFSNAAIILDEGQNATRGQLKMALTRLGDGSRMIVTGDPAQSDLMEPDSGLLGVADDLSGTPGIEIVRFDREHVVRSRIVAEVLNRI